MIIKPILYLILALLVIAILLTWLSAGVSLFFGGHYLEFFMTHSQGLNYAFVFQIFVLVSIPVLLLILSIYGLLRNRSRSIKPLKRKLDYIWGFNLVLLFCWVVFMAKDMSEGHDHLTSDSLQKTTHPISLQISTPDFTEGPLRINTPFIQMDKDHFYQHAALTISTSDIDQIVVERRQKARGPSSASAKTRIDAMNYSFALDSMSIHLADYFEIDRDAQWRGQFLSYNLKLPIGQKIVISDISHFQNRNFTLAETAFSPTRMKDKTWEMTEKGLRCLDCQSL